MLEQQGGLSIRQSMSHQTVRTPTATALSSEQQNMGMRLAYLGQSVGPVLTMLLMDSAFGILLVKHLGGSDFQAMLLGSLMLLPRVLQIPASLIVAPMAGKRFMLRCWIANCLAFVSVLVVTFLAVDGRTKVWIILVLLGIGSSLNMAGSTFWFPLLHDVVPENQRGRFFGKMRAAWSSSVFAAIFVVGVFLGKSPPLWKFQVVIAVGLVMNFARNAFIAKVPEDHDALAAEDYSDWKRYVLYILSRREVLIFWGYYSLLGFCAGFLSMPLVLYIRDKGFPACDNMIVFGFKMLGLAISVFLGGVLTDRFGTRRLFLAAHLVLFAVCFGIVGIGWLPANQWKYLMLLAMIVSGGVLGMADVACTAQLFHLAPDRGRAFFISLSMILVTGGSGVAPLVAGYVRQSVPDGWSTSLSGLSLDIFQVMLSASGLGMLILMILLLFVEDVRPKARAG